MASAQRFRQALALVAVLAVSGLSHADSFEYDETGNVETVTNPRGVRHYTYDAVNRLDTESGYTGDRDHAYDLNGNRSTDGAATPTVVTHASNSNRIATINGVSIAIDAAGQMASDGVNQLTWDGAGRLKTVSRNGVLRATYYYDHQNRRTRKVTTAAAPQGARTVMYQYGDASRLVAELTETGVPLRSYVWLNDTLIGQFDYVADATVNGGYRVARALYFELDQLGTPRQAKEKSGTTVWRWESDGYGNTPADEDPDGDGLLTTVNLRFPGQYYDEESGLHYNWNRYYSPRLGRYLSSDPVGVTAGNNTYSYVRSNPLIHTDPTGLNPWAGAMGGAEIGSVLGPVGAVAGGVVGAGVGAWLSWNVVGPMLSSGLHPGYWPADKGAAEWGRRNGFGARNGKGRFHGIKQSCPGSKPTDDYGVNPETGDVIDPTGEVIGNLWDAKPK